ncbi:endonuclease/exonuclease/phosphatase family protein [Rhizobium puerariae]|uniref:Endonuclease/exonuclease/phosphatase family protein n=1 Tax=Rhizobium puerariae TaxID=1585791 RepID=A0ABV6ALI1_9HYPH
MVNYAGLRFAFREEPAAAKRCAERLIGIRKTLEPLRARKKDSSLLLATWNIRDFDSNEFRFGPRLPETFYYIAEIISCFDLVAVQEINRDLSALDRVMRILGREWDYIATDVTEGTSGNGERMAFVYNTEKVWFRKIAGEIVLPEGQLVVSRKKVKAPKDQPDIEPKIVEMEQQFARTPFLVAFQSGWFRFSLCTVHIYFGDDSGDKLKRRISEIERLVEFFADRQDKESRLAEADKPHPDRREAENYILLGDFNVVSPEHGTMTALTKEGFKVPEEIDGARMPNRDHFYDQIAVRVKDKRFKVLGGGIVDMYADVFRSTPDDMKLYEQFVPKKDPEKNSKYRARTPEQLYEKWRTWQMSDHAPLWIEIQTDFAESYLREIVDGK